MQDLKKPELLFKALGAKLAVGMPFKDIATSDSIVLREVPPPEDAEARRAVRRLAVRPQSLGVCMGTSTSDAIQSQAPGFLEIMFESGSILVSNEGFWRRSATTS